MRSILNVLDILLGILRQIITGPDAVLHIAIIDLDLTAESHSCRRTTWFKTTSVKGIYISSAK